MTFFSLRALKFSFLTNLNFKVSSDFLLIFFQGWDLIADSSDWTAATWFLPSPNLDPFILPLSEIGKFTARRKGDMMSFNFQEGRLASATVRDLFLRLVRVGGIL